MYAIVKTESEANQLNDYIKAGYYQEVTGASFEQWTEVIQTEHGFAVEIMDFMQYRPVPDFIVNGIEFVNEIEKPIIQAIVI
jgi:beta-mannanase